MNKFRVEFACRRAEEVLVSFGSKATDKVLCKCQALDGEEFPDLATDLKGPWPNPLTGLLCAAFRLSQSLQLQAASSPLSQT